MTRSLSHSIGDYPDGIVLPIDKPYRWTSADVIRKVKYAAIRHFGKKNLKVGHAGTLDPLATGILLVCIGPATKRAEELQRSAKEYIAGVTFGATTPSYDLEKDIDRECPLDCVSEAALRAVLPGFVGEQDQVAPLFSAKSVDGVYDSDPKTNPDAVKYDTISIAEIVAKDLRLLVSGPSVIGITGKNGAGKSTLLRLLWADLRERRDLTAAYMPQDYAEVLDYRLTPIAFLAPDGAKDSVTLARTRMGSMRFTHGEMTGPIGSLSGGQRAKILFLDMVLRRANVLLLDEPTRNFSPLSAPVVRQALREFGGAILSVSHDRKYLAEVCDVVYELTPDGLRKRETGER